MPGYMLYFINLCVPMPLHIAWPIAIASEMLDELNEVMHITILLSVNVVLFKIQSIFVYCLKIKLT